MQGSGKRFLAILVSAAMLTATAGAPVSAAEKEEIAAALENGEQKATETAEISKEEAVTSETKASEETETKPEETEIKPEETETKPEETETPKLPETSDTSEGQSEPETPEMPQQSEVSSETKPPKTEETSNVSEGQSESETLETPQGPKEPSENGKPETVDTSDKPETPSETPGILNMTQAPAAESAGLPDTDTSVPEVSGKTVLSGEENTSGMIDVPEPSELSKPEFYALNDAFEVDGIKYKEVGAGRVRLMEGKQASGNLVIPEMVKKPGTQKEYRVVSIEGRAFASNKNLTGITLPSSLTSIGTYAFSGCSALTGNLVLPEGLAELGDYAFQSCAGLSGDIRLPDSLLNIGISAFYGCSGFNGSLVLPGNLTYLGKSTFDGCSGLQGTVLLPDSLNVIETYAFSRCQFTCEASSESVAALAYGSGYRNITLNGVLYEPAPINTSTFRVDDFYYKIIDKEKGYVQLSSSPSTVSGVVTIPDRVTYQEKTYQVTEIGPMAFHSKKNITGVIFPEGLLHIGDSAFDYCTGLSGTLTLPDSLVSIGAEAFMECTGLSGNLIFPENMKSIGKFAFMNCTGFNGSLQLPDSITNIGESAFFNCCNLRGTLTLPSGLTKISQNAFYNCSRLTGILTIPDSVTGLGSTAFQLCSGITEFQVGKGVQSIGSSAFPSGAKLVTGSPQVQLLLVEYLRLNEIPAAFWDGQEDVPGGAIVTVEKDAVISGDITIGEEAQVRIAPDVTVTVSGKLTVEGTVTVEGILLADGTINVTETGTIVRRKQEQLEIQDIGNRTYGDDSFTLAVNGGSGVGAVTFESSDPSVLSISGNTATIRKAGTVVITATKSEDYTFKETSAIQPVDIERKRVTIQAENISVKKEEQLPGFTYVPLTLAYQDRIETEPVLTSSVIDTGVIGEYSIEIKGAVLTNHDSYVIEYVPGILRVTDNLYTLKVNNSGDGATASGEFHPGERIELHAGTRNEYVFDGWISDNGGVFEDAASPDTGFIMPKADVVITANWKKEEGPSDNNEGGTGGNGGTGSNEEGTGGNGGSGSNEEGTGGNGGSGSNEGGTGGNGGSGDNEGNKKPDNDKKTEEKRKDDRKVTEPAIGTVSVDAEKDGKDGTISVNITEAHISQAVQAAKDAAADRDVNAGDISIKIQVTFDEDGSDENRVNHLKVNLSSEVQKQMKDNKISRVTFAAEKPGISVGLDLNAVVAVNDQAKGDVQLVITCADSTKLSGEAQVAIGSRPAFELNILYGSDQQMITDFGSGKMHVAVPYELQKEENPGGMQAVYVSEEGEATYLINSVYSSGKKVAYFAADCPGIYGLGYRTPASCKDVKTHPAKDDMEFVISRKLMEPLEDGVFGPEEPVTVEQFTACFEKLTGIDVTTGLERYFAGADTWQTLTRAQACCLLRHYTEHTISGSVSEGWLRNTSGSWAYYQDGRKLTGIHTIDGLWYEFGKDGLLKG